MTQNVSAQDARTAPDSNPVSWQAQDDVLLITINNPPVNALGHAVRVGLIAAIHQIVAIASSRGGTGATGRRRPSASSCSIVTTSHRCPAPEGIGGMGLPPCA